MASKSINRRLFLLLPPLMMASSLSGGNPAQQVKSFIEYRSKITAKEYDKTVTSLMSKPKDERTMGNILKRAEYYASLSDLLNANKGASSDSGVMVYLGRCIEIMPSPNTDRELKGYRIVHYGESFYLAKDGILEPIHRTNISESIKPMNYNEMLAFLRNNQLMIFQRPGKAIAIEAEKHNILTKPHFTARGLIYGAKLGTLKNQGQKSETIPTFGLVSMTESIANIPAGYALALST